MIYRFLIGVALLGCLFSTYVLGGDPRSFMPVKVTGQDNATDADVTAVGGKNRLEVNSSRTWTLLNSTDSVNAVQSGTWTTGRTWTLSNGSDSIAAVQSGTWNITNISGTISLPTGAATSALQTTGNTSLSSIDSKTPSLGQTTMAGSVPVAIASNQSAIPVSQSGTWTTGRTWSLLNTTDSVNAVQSGTWTTGRTWTLSSGTDSVAATQSGTWNITNITGTVSLPTGAATSALQTTGNTSLASIDTKTPALGQALMAASVPVTIASNQSAVKVDGSAVTQPVSGTVTANQGTSPWVTSRNWTLSSGTDSIAAVQSGTWNITNITGTVSLPTGAATSALQTTGNTSLSSIDGKTPTLGQKTMAGSTPVVIASDQTTIPVSMSGQSAINRQDVSGAKTTSGNSGALDSQGLEQLAALVSVSAFSGTSPTAQVHLQYSDDNATWFTLYDTVKFTTTGTSTMNIVRMSHKYYRYSWDITGTTPSVTISVWTTIKAVQTSRASRRFFYADIDLSTLGASSSTFVADDCRNVAVQYMRGADGGSNATVQVFSSIDQINWFSQTGNLAANVNSSNNTTFSNQAWPYWNIEVTAKSNPGTRTLDIAWSCN